MSKKWLVMSKKREDFTVQTFAFTLVTTAMLAAPAVFADGILLNGVGARSMAMGGADVAWASDPLGAMGANPAGLAFLNRPGANLGFVGGIADGYFSKAPTSSGNLKADPYGMPEGAFAIPVRDNITLGFSVVPTSALNASWKYFDPYGGLGGHTTYGLQTDHSEILVIRSAAGIGIAVTPKLSLGASFGLDYNQNLLETPFIFQSQPNLKGAKTLLSLHTDGLGFDGQFGVLYKAMTNLQFGLSYQSEAQINSTGYADGNVGVQLGAPSVPFHYDADVRNTFPQSIDFGGSWGFYPQWRLALQVDWVNWGDAFHTLPVHLSNGSNPAVNAAAGGSSLQDNVPLNWRDEFVYRAGLEYEVMHNLFLRGGYCYGASPVPDGTLTPMTAAITEQTLTAGVGYHWKNYQLDLAYQFDIPNTRNVGTSQLLDGEYSNSSVTVNVHWFALTLGATF
jgi:long-chain fatty acid transport protein